MIKKRSSTYFDNPFPICQADSIEEQSTDIFMMINNVSKPCGLFGGFLGDFGCSNQMRSSEGSKSSPIFLLGINL